MECNLVEKNDVIIKDEHINVMFDHPTKRRFKRFMHENPGWMIGSSKLYISQLDSKMKENSRFMSNMNDKRGARIQNMGEHTL